MINYPVESFPCIKCGCTLTRVNPEYEGQPNDGIMCSSYGNYGSTVFDPMDMSFLAFNICDGCVKLLAKQGRLYQTRSWIPIEMDGIGVVGRMRTERPYIQWNPKAPSDDATLHFSIDEIEFYQNKIELFHKVDKLREWSKE